MMAATEFQEDIMGPSAPHRRCREGTSTRAAEFYSQVFEFKKIAREDSGDRLGGST